MQNKGNGNKAAGILLIVFACLIWAVGIFAAVIFFMAEVGRAGYQGDTAAQMDMEEFMENSIETPGIVEFVYVDSGKEYTNVEFNNGTGPVTVEIGTYSEEYPEGRPITVYYDRESPYLCAVPALSDQVHAIDSNIFYSMGYITGAGIVFFVVGLVLLIVGINLTAKSKKKVIYN